MTLRKQLSVRTLVLSLLLAFPFVGVGCWEPDLKDAEIGCGLDAYASPKCPNRPATEAGPPSPDGLGDGGVRAETGNPVPDTAPPGPDTAPISADSAADQAFTPDLAVDTPVADSASARGSDALTD